MATLTKLMSSAYINVAADVTSLNLIQCPSSGSDMHRGIELVAAGSQPAVTVRGVELRAGDMIVKDDIPSLGTGALYAKTAWGSAHGEILTV